MPTIEQATPPLTRTIEKGDRFIRRDVPDRIYTVIGKIYHDDLSLSYQMETEILSEEIPPRIKLRFTVHESTIKNWPWFRIWRTQRTEMYREKAFKGVFYGAV